MSLSASTSRGLTFLFASLGLAADVFALVFKLPRQYLPVECKRLKLLLGLAVDFGNLSVFGFVSSLALGEKVVDTCFLRLPLFVFKLVVICDLSGAVVSG